MLLPDAIKQWLFQISHALVMSSRVLGSVPRSYVDRLCNQRQVTSSVSCSLPKLDLAFKQWKRRKQLGKQKCCKLFSQQEMDHCKYLINVQRICLKFENNHPFSMFFSLFQSVFWRDLDLKGKVVEMFSCWKYVYLWTQLETIHCIGSALPARPILESWWVQR